MHNFLFVAFYVLEKTEFQFHLQLKYGLNCYGGPIWMKLKVSRKFLVPIWNKTFDRIPISRLGNEKPLHYCFVSRTHAKTARWSIETHNQSNCTFRPSRHAECYIHTEQAVSHERGLPYGRLHSVELLDDWRITNWKAFGRKWSWPTRYLLGRTEVSHKNTCQDSQCPGQDSNQTLKKSELYH
jgi:hypothetical protein